MRLQLYLPRVHETLMLEMHGANLADTGSHTRAASTCTLRYSCRKTYWSAGQAPAWSCVLHILQLEFLTRSSVVKHGS